MNYNLGLSTYPIFDETYRNLLNAKILAHYEFYEIGFETAGLFKNRLNQKMEEIMPYYNQLYKSAQIEFDPITNHSYTENYEGHDNNKSTETQKDNRKTTNDVTGDSETNGTGKETVEEKGSGTTKNQSTGENKTYASDTPQGLLSSDLLENELYISNAALGKSEDTGSGETTKQATQNKDTTSKTTGHTFTSGINEDTYSSDKDKKDDFWKQFERKLSGYTGSSPSDLLQKYRETFLNIDMMVINELSELFMLIW